MHFIGNIDPLEIFPYNCLTHHFCFLSITRATFSTDPVGKPGFPNLQSLRGINNFTDIISKPILDLPRPVNTRVDLTHDQTQADKCYWAAKATAWGVGHSSVHRITRGWQENRIWNNLTAVFSGFHVFMCALYRITVHVHFDLLMCDIKHYQCIQTSIVYCLWWIVMIWS